MKKKQYNARWGQAGQPTVANVTIVASHDENAKKAADKLGRKMGVSHSPRTIYEGNRLVG